jgi:hypothetical protein
MKMGYIAAGANRHPAVADWAGELLAFGSGRNIALWRPHVGFSVSQSPPAGVKYCPDLMDHACYGDKGERIVFKHTHN